MTTNKTSKTRMSTEQLDDLVRDYAIEHGELGALDDVEQTSKGLLYAFEGGLVKASWNGTLTIVPAS